MAFISSVCCVCVCHCILVSCNQVVINTPHGDDRTRERSIHQGSWWQIRQQPVYKHVYLPVVIFLKVFQDGRLYTSFSTTTVISSSSYHRNCLAAFFWNNKKNYLCFPHPIPRRNFCETRLDLDGDLIIKAICVWQIISNQRFVNEKLVFGKPPSAYI